MPGVKVAVLENAEIQAWGQGVARARGGSRAKTCQGVQRARGPRKLLDFSCLAYQKSHFLVIYGIIFNQIFTKKI
jgi:hypothetical protein